ncbi:hypothetical protein AB0D14_15620 [Streptomyces sp. NPDC048484]|uniref:hypothetical protein n=1 Tax=Streptomyces sp. NPDC048484 TaxID=3155146 RepID=UPI00343847C1
MPTSDMVTQLADRLARSGIAPTEITQDGPRGDQGVHIGTMYRFKGLEYRCLIIAGVAEGLVPRSSVDAWEHTDPTRHQREALTLGPCLGGYGHGSDWDDSAVGGPAAESTEGDWHRRRESMLRP